MVVDLTNWIGYCAEPDLMANVDVRLPEGINKAGVIRDAADEIDSMIGFLYRTPVVFETEENKLKYRPTLLVLKRINRYLATGRLVLAAAASGEQSTLHAYGQRMVDEALAALNAIVERKIILEGALPNENDPSSYQVSQGYISNLDPYSRVEDFYDNILNAPVGTAFTGLFGDRPARGR